jgi:hypothetical protein
MFPRLHTAFFQFIRPRKPIPRSTISSVSLTCHRNTAHASGSRGSRGGSAQKRACFFSRSLMSEGLWVFRGRFGRYWRQRRERRMFRTERPSSRERESTARPPRHHPSIPRLWCSPASSSTPILDVLARHCIPPLMYSFSSHQSGHHLRPSTPRAIMLCFEVSSPGLYCSIFRLYVP